MFIKILKKDLKRSRTMNLILFLFIILSTVFVSSGLSNLISVTNGMDFFLTEALGDKTDYFLLVPTGNDDSKLTEILDKSDAVKSYAYDKYYGYHNDIYDEKDRKIVWYGAVMIQSPDDCYIKLFDSSNNVIKSVKKGHVYVTAKFLKEHNILPGDKVRLEVGGKEEEYIIDGGLKDAFLGSSISANNRFIMNDEDVDKYFESDKDGVSESRVVYVKTDDLNAVKKDISDIDGSVEIARNTVILTRIVEMMVAFVVVILSICLIIVSFVILRFSIGFTIQDDFREIGVMKAIGIRNFKIRSLYLVKYLALSIAGVVIGCVISYPFGEMLLNSVSENMLLGNNFGKTVNLAGAFLVFALIMWSAFTSTGRVKKMTPVDAIRSGETGERFNKKRGIRIGRSHLKNAAYLAWNDILSSPKRYINIVISFGICTLFLLIIANLTATLDSNAFIDTFSVRADLYMKHEDSRVVDISGILDKYGYEPEINELEDNKRISPTSLKNYSNGREIYEDYLKLLEDKLADEGIPAKVFNDILYSYKFTFNGEEYNYSFYQVIGNSHKDYPMLKGFAPQNKNEIAITQIVADEFGMNIGDAIEIDFGDVKEKCTVTGIFQSMNNFGAVIRIHEDSPTDLKYYSGFMETLIDFTDNPDKETIESRKEQIKEILNADKVKNQVEECVDNIGILDTMKAVEVLLMTITIIVIVLVTVMMERSFIAKESKQIAILKAVGFRDSDVIKWQVIRFAILGVISVILAMIISIPVTTLAGNAVFSMMGAASVKWVYSIESLLKYPVILEAVTVLITFFTALYTRTINARDTASIE